MRTLRVTAAYVVLAPVALGGVALAWALRTVHREFSLYR
jgi:hypothetical protein